jgi:hypothetical protein
MKLMAIPAMILMNPHSRRTLLRKRSTDRSFLSASG